MFPNEMKSLKDLQDFHQWLDEQKGWDPDLYYNMLLLTGEVGEVAQVLKRISWRASVLQKENQGSMEEALAEYRADLGSELADCLAYILKMANNAGVDLTQAYLTKMAKNVNRTWTTPPPPEEQG